jgi:hypothetical protein
MAAKSTNFGLTYASPAKKRIVRQGLIALTIGWLAWFYWFSRAALLAIVTLTLAFALFLALRSAYRVTQAGSGIYRTFCHRLLLSLARRIV